MITKRLIFLPLIVVILSAVSAPGATLKFTSDWEEATVLPNEHHEIDGWSVSTVWSGHRFPHYDPVITQSMFRRNGNFAVRLHIERDTTDWSDSENPRIDLTKNSDHLCCRARQSEEWWYGLSHYIPLDWVEDTNPDLHWQIHGHGHMANDVPSMSLRIVGDEYLFQINENQDGETSLFNKVIYKWPLIKGEWVDWVLHFRLELQHNGYVELWKDGELVVEYSGSTTYDIPDGSGITGPEDYSYFMLDNYKFWWLTEPSTTTERTVCFDEIRIAQGPDGYDDVAPRDKH